MADYNRIYLGHEIEPVRKVDLLTGLLIRERKSVLFVGEGDFTFTVAFATLRESEKPRHSITNPGVWDGITSTRYERISVKHRRPNFDKIVNDCRSSFTSNLQHTDETTWRQRCVFDELTPPPPPQCWQFGVDARNIASFSARNPDVVWFQCPWLLPEEPITISTLIHSFLVNTWEWLEPGKYVCIGITTHEMYVDRYELEKILGKRRGKSDILGKYVLCGADQKLVRNVLKFGYHHQGITDVDIHKMIKNHHITLVFRKKQQLAKIKPQPAKRVYTKYIKPPRYSPYSNGQRY